MALKKGSKSKGTAKKVVNQGTTIMDIVEKATGKSDLNVKVTPEGIQVSPKTPELIESEIDQDVRSAIRLLGESQSKFQQLRILRKSKKLRHIIKLARLISNDFK